MTTALALGVGTDFICSPEDYEAVVEILGTKFPNPEKEGFVLVGHGTDHPIWSSYVGIVHMFRERFGSKTFMGVVEG